MFSAAGLISTDVVYSFARSTHKTVGAGPGVGERRPGRSNDAFAALDDQARRGVRRARVEPRAGARGDLCYLRQILDFDIRVPALRVDGGRVQAAATTFDERYAAIYGEGAAAPDAATT